MLGSGGMGAVYVAVHPRLPRRDALKVLSAEYSTDPEFRARFIREAELAARLEHPNIVGVYDRGIDYGRLWIAMRLMDGPDAATLIRHRVVELSPQRVLHIVGSVARGLDHAHRAGMLHRDVKPANILVESIPGQPDRVAITDFGIAKAAAATTLTQAGTILATVPYAAPEQLTGAPVDHRADIYSLGCTLYELLTGAKPFPRTTTDAVITAHLHDAPPRPTALVPELPRPIDDVIARALAKDPQRRFPTCGALADAAATAFGVPPDPASVVGPKPDRRRKLGIRVGALTAVVVAAIASVFLLNRNSTDDSPSGAPSSTPSETSPVDPNSWAAHEWLIKAFPQLLPKTQADSGYQGLRCIAIDPDLRPIDARETRGSTNELACNGNRDPVSRVQVRCGIDKPADVFKPSATATVVGEEDWQRPTGQGHATWTNTNGLGGPTGELLLSFTDPTRANCALGVVGGTSGQDLYDRWWRNAPL